MQNNTQKKERNRREIPRKSMWRQKGKYIGEDMHGKLLHIGDTVSIQQAWEDEAGHYHDETGLTIRTMLPDGCLKFSFGDWRTRNAWEQKLQAWINQFEWYCENVEKEL